MDSQIEIQILASNDIDKLLDLITVFEVAFEMENFRLPSTPHLQKLLEKETFFAIVALHDNKVIGGLTVYVLDQYYSAKSLAYLYDLAVWPAHQRKGIGKKLVDFTREYFGQQGFEELFVQADKVDDHAIDFYRLTKPTGEDPVVQFSYVLARTDETHAR